ncbi:MAG: SurA N-terminal domain-containing protein [Bacteroidales bacterium]
MAVLETIRVKLGALITVLIAVALLAFIIDPNTLGSVFNSLSSKYDVGEIDGTSVTYNEFKEKVDYYSNIYTLTSGNQSMDEKTQQALNESAWQDFQQEMFIVPTIKKAGIRIGTEELLDMSQGKEISRVLLQQPSFLDENGQFSRAKLLQFMQAIPSDQTGNLSTYWAFLEKNMTREKYYSKYVSLLTKSNVINKIEMKNSIADNNTTSSADFIVLPIGFGLDSTITVSNSEIEEYYKVHKSLYKQKASRDVDFVCYEVVPSEEDFKEAKADIDKVYPDFVKATNLKTFLSRNSATPLSDYYFSEDDVLSVYPKLDTFAFHTKNATVFPIYRKGEQYIAARINDTKVMSDSAFVKHILVKDASKADSLLNVLKHGGDFSELAKKYSLDQNTKVASRGDIGWMTQTQMIPGMQDVLTAKVGKDQIMNTQYGTHIVRVTKRTPAVKKVQLAILSKEVIASKKTFQNYYSQANDLASKSDGKIENFNKIVKEDKLPVVPASNVAESARKISKYEDVPEVTRWIYGAKKGEVSPIITINNKYFFVVALKEVREDRYAPVNQVASNIQMILAQKKRAEKLAETTAEKIKGLTSMKEIAEKLNTTVSSRDDISFGSITSRSFDPVLVGSIAGAPENEICGPIAGNVGVYIFKVKSRNVGNFFSEDDAKTREDQMMNYQINALNSIFQEEANLIDHRAKFF